MRDKDPYIYKAYSSPFVLDRGKLSRITSILEQSFKEVGAAFEPGYEVVLRDGKKLNLADIEQVLAQDNTVKNSIISLDIHCSGSTSSNGEYGYYSAACGFANTRDSNISIRAYSDDEKWASRIFAELEEQVERTFISNWVYKYVKTGKLGQYLTLSFLVVWFAFLLVSPFLRGTSRNVNLAEQDINDLQNSAQLATTLEDKVEFLFEVQKRQLGISMRTSTATAEREELPFNLRTLFLLLPIFIVVGCTFYAIRYCYPHAVFLWGDYEGHYKGLMSKRSLMWNIVFGAIGIGVIANLFVFAIADYLRLE